jgi:hypothetical protein
VCLLLLVFALRCIRPESQPLRPFAILSQLPDQLPFLTLSRQGDARPPIPLRLFDPRTAAGPITAPDVPPFVKHQPLPAVGSRRH